MEPGAPMKIIACLPESSFVILQRSLAPGQFAQRVTDRRQLRLEFVRGDADLLILDPELGREEFFDSAVRDVTETPLAVVLMTRLSGQVVARRILSAARHGITDVLLEPYDTEARFIGARLRQAHESRATVMLLRRLSQPLGSLPNRLQVSLLESMFGGIPPATVDALALAAALSRHTIDRWLHRAGIRAPKLLLDGVRLARLKDRFAHAEGRQARAFESAGFVSRRTAAERCSHLVRCSLGMAMTRMPTSEFVERLMSAMLRPGVVLSERG